MKIPKSVTVIFDSKNKSLYNVTYTTKEGINVTLLEYSLDRSPQPYRYISFQEIYQTVLHLLYNNYQSPKYLDTFGARWYEINWIDINNPTKISRYGTNIE